jgi:hypothetical protein
MNKKWWIGILSVIFVLACIGSALSEDKGDPRKGKYAYRNIYKLCHERGGTDSAKPAVGPDGKTQAQWKKVFDAKDFEEFGCKAEWDKLSTQELLDIYTYLHDHAADSPAPAKCK